MYERVPDILVPRPLSPESWPAGAGLLKHLTRSFRFTLTSMRHFSPLCPLPDTFPPSFFVLLLAWDFLTSPHLIRAQREAAEAAMPPAQKQAAIFEDYTQAVS